MPGVDGKYEMKEIDGNVLNRQKSWMPGVDGWY